jgi:hypothetical protein
MAEGGLLEPRMIAVGDLNGDGRVDVVYPRKDGIGIMPGNAAGGLGPEQVLPYPPESTAATATTGATEANLAVADLDGDGRADLVVLPFEANGAEVRLQDASGALVRSGFYACAHSYYDRVAIGDADGDGRLDIAIANQTEICVLRQRADGTFAPAISLPVSAPLPITALGVGPFGAVGCGPGIAFATDGNQPESMLGLFSWSAAMNGFVGPSYQKLYDIPDGMVVADVDGDGRSDVVVMHAGWQNVSVFRAAPGGGLAAEELYPIPYINSGLDRLAVGDVNGDDRPDVITADFDLTVVYHR